MSGAGPIIIVLGALVPTVRGSVDLVELAKGSDPGQPRAIKLAWKQCHLPPQPRLQAFQEMSLIGPVPRLLQRRDACGGVNIGADGEDAPERRQLGPDFTRH